MKMDIAQRFMSALRRCEDERNPELLARLFTDDARLENMAIEIPGMELTPPREFWQRYLNSFQEIRSHFENVVRSEGTIVLEWVSQGTLRNGRAVNYKGLSILELEPNDEERIRSFRTYYDNEALTAVRSARSAA